MRIPLTCNKETGSEHQNNIYKSLKMNLRADCLPFHTEGIFIV